MRNICVGLSTVACQNIDKIFIELMERISFDTIWNGFQCFAFVGFRLLFLILFLFDLSLSKFVEI